MFGVCRNLLAAIALSRCARVRSGRYVGRHNSFVHPCTNFCVTDGVTVGGVCTFSMCAECVLHLCAALPLGTRQATWRVVLQKYPFGWMIVWPGLEHCPGLTRMIWQVGVVEKLPKEKGGRKITRQGQQDCDRIAAELYAAQQTP